MATFSEYVPISLLLICFFEARTRSSLAVHLLGPPLLGGRALHAWGVSQPREDFRYRAAGMALTFDTLVGGSVILLISALL